MDRSVGRNSPGRGPGAGPSGIPGGCLATIPATTGPGSCTILRTGDLGHDDGPRPTRGDDGDTGRLG